MLYSKRTGSGSLSSIPLYFGSRAKRCGLAGGEEASERTTDRLVSSISERFLLTEDTDTVEQVCVWIWHGNPS